MGYMITLGWNPTHNFFLLDKSHNLRYIVYSEMAKKHSKKVGDVIGWKPEPIIPKDNSLGIDTEYVEVPTMVIGRPRKRDIAKMVLYRAVEVGSVVALAVLGAGKAGFVLPPIVTGIAGATIVGAAALKGSREIYKYKTGKQLKTNLIDLLAKFLQLAIEFVKYLRNRNERRLDNGDKK